MLVELPELIKTHQISAFKIHRIITRASLWGMVRRSASSSSKSIFSPRTYFEYVFHVRRIILWNSLLLWKSPYLLFLLRIWHWLLVLVKEPRWFFFTSFLYIRFLPFTEELSEISLFEKAFNFILKNSTIGAFVGVIFMDFAPEFLAPFTWIYSYLFWLPYLVSHIFEYHYQFGHIEIEVVVD